MVLSDRSLFLFPLLAALLGSGIAVGLYLPALENDGHMGSTAWLVRSLVFAVVMNCLFVFADAVIVAAATERLASRDGSLRRGALLVARRSLPLLAWAVFAAWVGLGIRFISRRLGVIGGLAGGLADLAWAVGTFFAVPLIVFEAVLPDEAISLSTMLVKQTWGEQVVGSFAISTVVLLAALPLAAICAALAAISPLAAIVAGAALLALVIAVSRTVAGVFTAALYQYAITGAILAPFLVDDYELAFRRRGYFSGSDPSTADAEARAELRAVDADHREATDDRDRARSLDTTSEELRELAHSPFHFVSEAVAANPNTPADVLQALLPTTIEQHHDSSLVLALARNPSTPPAVLDQMPQLILPNLKNVADHHLSEATVALAERSDIGETVINALASDDRISTSLREKVASASRNQTLLVLLERSGAPRVRQAAERSRAAT